MNVVRLLSMKFGVVNSMENMFWSWLSTISLAYRGDISLMAGEKLSRLRFCTLKSTMMVL